MTMNKRMWAGVLWNLASLLTSRGASIVFTLFLARLLAPEAFGLMAMTVVAFELANVLVESGLGFALIRSKKVSQADLSTIFFANLGLGLVAYAILFAGGPYVASFYDEPALGPLVRAGGLAVFFNGIKVVQIANLRRAMDFQLEMKANSGAVLISGVCGVGLAYVGAGVWSLVAQMLLSAMISSLILWLASDWRPSLSFSVEAFNRLFSFGSHLTFEGALEVFHQNSYLFVIGAFFSAEITGLYFFARKLSNLLTQQLSSAVQQATFPALATLQDDNVTLRHRYRQIIQLMMFMIAPVLLLFAAVVEPFFDLLFGPRWSGAVLYLQLLLIVGVLYPLHALNVNILNVKGRSDLVLKVGLVKKTLSLGLLVSTVQFGVTGIILGQLVGSVLSLLPHAYLSDKLIGYGLKDQLTDLAKPILAASVASSCASLLSQSLSGMHTLFLVGTSFTVGIIVYLIVSKALKAEGFLMAFGIVFRRYKDVLEVGSSD
jgi:lipopolysaccharide exporter